MSGFRIAGEGFVLRWGDGGAEPDGIPRLREEVRYPVLLRSTGDAPVALAHRDPTIVGRLHSSEDGRVVHGVVGFGGQVGWSDWEVWVGGRVAHRFRVEVLPTKLDYREDYPRLIADTQALLRALVLAYLRATYGLGASRPAEGVTELEWLLGLRDAADRLERALLHISRHPRREVDHAATITRAERVRRPDAALVRAVLRGAGRGREMRLGGLALRERIPAPCARPTLDTPEHRWLAAQLRHVRRRLAALRRREMRAASAPRHAQMLTEVAALEQRIARLERLEPFAAATGNPPPGAMPLAFAAAPGYREAHRACRSLMEGLHLSGGPAHLPLRELHLLYEQWCYLALVRVAADVVGAPLPGAELLVADARGLRVRLGRGREHRVLWSLPDGGSVSLVYNPRFGGEPLLVPQQPDILLEIQRPGEPRTRLVLDAKYRIDSSAAYRRRYGCPGPPEEALNTLHRYRDALVERREGAPERTVVQAVALFPGGEGEPGAFWRSRLWTSISEIGVGALPLLPGNTRHLAAWLRGWLAAPPG